MSRVDSVRPSVKNASAEPEHRPVRNQFFDDTAGEAEQRAGVTGRRKRDLAKMRIVHGCKRRRVGLRRQDADRALGHAEHAARVRKKVGVPPCWARSQRVTLSSDPRVRFGRSLDAIVLFLAIGAPRAGLRRVHRSGGSHRVRWKSRLERRDTNRIFRPRVCGRRPTIGWLGGRDGAVRGGRRAHELDFTGGEIGAAPVCLGRRRL